MPRRPRRPRRPLAPIALAAALPLAAACGAGGPAAPDIGYGNTGTLGGGLGGGGFNAFGFDLPSADYWDYAYFAKGFQEEAGFEDPARCFADGFCGLGGKVTRVGTVTSGAAAPADTFLFVTTTDFTRSFAPGVVRVRSSGVRTKPVTVADAAQLRGLRLVLEWALLSGRADLRGAVDTVSVRVRAGGAETVVFTATTADLADGRLARRAAGCGQETLGRLTGNSVTSATVTYQSCTDWQTAVIDLGPWRARPGFVLRFIASEGRPNAADQTDQPTTLLVRRAAIEAGR
jgi:hypothetical protein